MVLLVTVCLLFNYKRCAGLPCFFPLTGRRLSPASPARQDSTKLVASTDINPSICAGALICVSSRLNPLLFRRPFNACLVPPFPAICAPCSGCSKKSRLTQIRQPFIANWRTNSAVMMLARQPILALCQERCCFKMSEKPLAFGMVCVVAKLALCHVFQRVLFFCRV